MSAPMISFQYCKLYYIVAGKEVMVTNKRISLCPLCARIRIGEHGISTIQPAARLQARGFLCQPPASLASTCQWYTGEPRQYMSAVHR